MPWTGCEPSSATADAQVAVHCVPGACCDVSTRHGSDVPTRLPLESHVFGVQPVKVGDGPRYTNTFSPPTWIWNRGDPPPPSSSVT
jgi:hypothetical protein